MKLTRHVGVIGIYYTTSLDIAQSDYFIRRDPTVKQRRYTVARRQNAINGIAPQWEWEVVHDAQNLNGVRDFIAADRIDPQ